MTQGRKIRPSGISGRVTAYTHEVSLKIGEDEFQADVAFTDELEVPINLLGRKSIFEKYSITFLEKARRMILGTPD